MKQKHNNIAALKAAALAAQAAPIPAVTVGQAIQEYLTAKTLKGSKQYLLTLKYVLRRKLDLIVGLPLVQVTPDQIRQCLCDPRLTPRTQRLNLAVAKGFFRWAQAQGYVDRQKATAAELVQLPAPPPIMPRILTPGELKALLAAADVESRLAIALGCFAGIRWGEMERLQWEDFIAGEIRVDELMKGRRRLVLITPLLETWLQPFYGSKGRIFGSRAALKRRVVLSARKLGIQWAPNILRHTCATYTVALTQDLESTAIELGLPLSLMRYFVQPITEYALYEFIALTPESVGIDNWEQVVAEHLAKSAAPNKARRR